MIEILELHPVTARLIIDMEKYNDDRQCCFEECKEEAKQYKLIEDIYSHSGRWSKVFNFVIQRLSDGKYFKGSYSCGATECQDESAFEYDEIVKLNQVIPVKKTIIAYEEIIK